MPTMSPDETVRAALQLSHARLRRQHELVAEFGVMSLKALHLEQLLSQACVVSAKGLQTRFAKLLTPISGCRDFLLSYGVGWDIGDIGTATVGADEASPAGYAFMTNRPIISNHLGQENRFRTPALLKKYGIKRAINVPIRGVATPFGVLEVDGTDGDDFIESDLVFLEGIANVIAMAVERMAARSDDVGIHPYSESVLNASPDCVKIISSSGYIEFFNQAGLCRMGFESLDQVIGLRWVDLWPETSKPVVDDALACLLRGESVRFESYCPTTNGKPGWWDVTGAPIYDRQGNIEKIIAVSRDITERHDHENQLLLLIDSQNSRLDESNLHLEEIHHRVRNSLQLVNTLLLLQANMATEEAVKIHLNTAANRVMAIATVHDRLYENTNAGSPTAEPYLRALIQDLSKTFDDRNIFLDLEEFDLPPERMAPLGLIISELVTNSLKYGRGDIQVSVCNARDNALQLKVVDEGDGFPATYPKPSGTGLGMRLVRTYSGFGSTAVTVDRQAPTSTIQVRFKL